MKNYPVLFEINTRVFLRRFDTKEKRAALMDVPVSYWESLATKGVNAVWLMGIWKTCSTVIESCCFEEGLRKSYDKSLKNWRREDVIGSPYAIDCYEVNPAIGSTQDILAVKKVLNDLNIALVLDFIPNHFSADSCYIQTNPEIFLECDAAAYQQDVHTFFQNPKQPGKYFAHGRDPFFPAWTDTTQINYYSAEARAFMTQQMLKIAGLCDGVRCDMAMLVLNNIFQNTWGGILYSHEGSRPESEFWQDAIAEVKLKHPGFVFIAEAYWDLEWDLQQLGFTYTYDKRLYDRLKSAPVRSINAHLKAEIKYQNKLVRFIENHDEERAVAMFGKEQSFAAAVIMATIPGMRLFHDGQWEGKKIKLPVQLGREPVENKQPSVELFYELLRTVTADELFHNGEWRLLETIPSSAGNFHYENMLAWEWRLKDEHALVIVNYSVNFAQCRVRFEAPVKSGEFLLRDVFNKDEYYRTADEVQKAGLYVELLPWHTHIFRY
jgi:glycosidase